jgi:hypothetical protein
LDHISLQYVGSLSAPKHPLDGVAVAIEEGEKQFFHLRFGFGGMFGIAPSSTPQAERRRGSGLSKATKRDTFGPEPPAIIWGMPVK